MEKLAQLNQIEQDILKIIEQRIAKNKKINIKALQIVTKQQLSYSNLEISKAIYNLLLKKVIFTERKLILSTVLLNENRVKILDYILENPGVHIRELREKLTLNPKVLNWHLKVLENFEYIYRRPYLKYVTFFPYNFPRGRETLLLSLKNENAFQILTSIYEQPDLNAAQIKQRLNISSKILNYHLEFLMNSGIVISYKSNGIEFFKVDEKIIASIQKYLKFRLKKEKEVELPPAPERADLLHISREYDYVGGEILFKVTIQNLSKTVISEIAVTLIPSSQYEITEKVKIIEFLKHQESRGMEFYLTPLTCGNSKLFGSVSFMDAFGKPHTVTIEPHEIWIKCPLVQPKKAGISEIETLKLQLQHGIAKIPFKIDRKSAFDVVTSQISALDLAIISIDELKLIGLYSGIAKVTSDSLIIESKIQNQETLITVWTKDMKQATGFLAYLKNLLIIAFDSMYKLAGKTEKVSQKILDIDELMQRFLILFNYSEENWNVENILLLINEIRTKLQRIIPGSPVLEKLNLWTKEFERISTQIETITEKISIDLEFNIIDWLLELYKIAYDNLETYRQTFPEQDAQIQQLQLLLEKEGQAIKGVEMKYPQKILQYLMILDKNSGVVLFEYKFSQYVLESDLFGGFLTAIQSFGVEISKKETSVKKLSYHDFEIAIEDKNVVRVALIMNGIPIENILKKLKDFTQSFESQYEKELKDWQGNVDLFKNTDELLKKIFI